MPHRKNPPAEKVFIDEDQELRDMNKLTEYADALVPLVKDYEKWSAMEATHGADLTTLKCQKALLKLVKHLVKFCEGERDHLDDKFWQRTKRWRKSIKYSWRDKFGEHGF